MKSAVLVLCALIAAAASQWPLERAGSGADEFLFYNAAYDSAVIAHNTTHSNYLYVLDCDGISFAPCPVSSIISQPSVFNFGNKAAFNGDTLIASGNVGALYTYSCNFTTLVCEEQVKLVLPGNSDPYNLVYDSENPEIFYATYPQFNGEGPAFVVIDCFDNTRCVAREYINDFVGSCLEASGITQDCLQGGPLGFPITITATLGVVIVGFPGANGGRGGALVYDCTESPCVIQSQVENPYDFDNSYFNPGENFAASISSSFYDGEINLVVGVPGVLSDWGYDDENLITNFKVGGIYMYRCYTDPEWECISYETITYPDMSYNDCDGLDTNLGSSVSIYQDYIVSGAPQTCDGTGHVETFYCSFNNSCYEDNSYTTGYFLTGDEYGKDVYASDSFIISNAKSEAYLYFGYDIMKSIATTGKPGNNKFSPEVESLLELEALLKEEKIKKRAAKKNKIEHPGKNMYKEYMKLFAKKVVKKI